METIQTLIETICLDASEDISVKAYFMNGALFVSKPHCYPNLSIEFYVMSSVNTNKKSSLENILVKFISPCIIATLNTIRAQSVTFY